MERRIEFKSRIQVKQKDNNTVEKKKKEKNFFDEIKSYLEEKQKDIYLNLQSFDNEVQRKAIIYWDKMELLLEKLEENRNNKEYLNNLHEKIVQLKKKEKGIER